MVTFLVFQESFSTEAKFSFESIKSDCLSRLVPPVSSPTPMSPPGEGSGSSNVPALVVSPVSKSPLSRVTVTEDAIEDLLLKWIDLCGEANSLANFMDLLSKLLPLWHVAHDDLERCQALFIYCGPLVRIQEKLTEHTVSLVKPAFQTFSCMQCVMLYTSNLVNPTFCALFLSCSSFHLTVHVCTYV